MTREELIRLAIRYARKSVRQGTVPANRTHYDWNLYDGYTLKKQGNKWADRCTAILEYFNEPHYRADEVDNVELPEMDYVIRIHERGDAPHMILRTVPNKYRWLGEETIRHTQIKTIAYFC